MQRIKLNELEFDNNLLLEQINEKIGLCYNENKKENKLIFNADLFRSKSVFNDNTNAIDRKSL